MLCSKRRPLKQFSPSESAEELRCHLQSAEYQSARDSTQQFKNQGPKEKSNSKLCRASTKPSVLTSAAPGFLKTPSTSIFLRALVYRTPAAPYSVPGSSDIILFVSYHSLIHSKSKCGMAVHRTPEIETTEPLPPESHLIAHPHIRFLEGPITLPGPTPSNCSTYVSAGRGGRWWKGLVTRVRISALPLPSCVSGFTSPNLKPPRV